MIIGFLPCNVVDAESYLLKDCLKMPSFVKKFAIKIAIYLCHSRRHLSGNPPVSLLSRGIPDKNTWG